MSQVSRAGAVALGLLWVWSTTASAAEPAVAPGPVEKQWVPTVELEAGTFDERLQVVTDGTSSDSYRTQIRSLLLIGLSHPVLSLSGRRLWIDGQAAVGLGLVFDSGHWQLPLREDWTLAWAAERWLTLRAGLGLGVSIDVTSPPRSFFEVAIPLSATFFRCIELVYRPFLGIPVSSEDSPVFGGEKQLSTRLTFIPLDVAIRVRIGGLGW